MYAIEFSTSQVIATNGGNFGLSFDRLALLMSYSPWWLLEGLSMKARISSALQAVILGPRWRTGAGYLPDLTPAHQVDLLTGMMAGIGGFALGLPRIWESRT
ncbi:hypothetical protein [Citrifermentans bemidjiense]|nr:hypothetical protein [Citrifermentans bemidjiense]